jgi:hypothetical protein
MPEIGHKREDLTGRPVKSWNDTSTRVYDPASSSLTIVAVLPGARDVKRFLTDSLADVQTEAPLSGHRHRCSRTVGSA